MERLALIVLLSTAVITGLGGCDVQENSLLLEVTTDAYVQSLEVETRSLEVDGVFDLQRTTIDRDAASIAAEPLRIAISLAEPGPVALRIVARGIDGQPTHSAFRCYQISGIVNDTFALLATSAADMDGDGWQSDLVAGCGEPCNDFLCPADLADCDDGAFGTNPGSNEDCGVNVNCNPADDRPCDDGDDDGYEACPIGVRDASCDCEDANAAINPGAVEACPSTVDANCDGVVGDVCDNDMDGFLSDVDCDDADPAINSAAMELCPAEGGGGVDENCNGRVDELCQPDDLDGDGFTAGDGDCDLCEAGSYPGAPEVCGDGVDQDCDMSDLGCGMDPRDADDDGVQSVAVGGRDCDDARADVNPNAAERCDTGADEDCDGMIDEGCPDPDGDGYVETGAFADCEGDATRFPGQVETCDGVDQDCDGMVDEGAAEPGAACVRDLAGAPLVLDFSTDLEHCGGCAMSCNPVGESIADQCVAGVCACRDNGRDSLPCAVGEICCQGMGSAGGCHQLSTSFDSCGACDNACDAERADACVDGMCRCGAASACAPGELCCGGSCVRPLEDPNNCGACGARCGANEACTGGRCDCFGDVASEVGRQACSSAKPICCVRHSDCRKNC